MLPNSPAAEERHPPSLRRCGWFTLHRRWRHLQSAIHSRTRDTATAVVVSLPSAPDDSFRRQEDLGAVRSQRLGDLEIRETLGLRELSCSTSVYANRASNSWQQHQQQQHQQQPKISCSTSVYDNNASGSCSRSAARSTAAPAFTPARPTALAPARSKNQPQHQHSRQQCPRYLS